MHPASAEIVGRDTASALVDAYDRVASEYDEPCHDTTRILEELSQRALAQAHERTPGIAVREILEVGAGTGALTEALLSEWPGAKILATDPSRAMLDVLEGKLGNVASQLATALCDASQACEVIERAPDLIAAGLADPFLDRVSLSALRSCAVDGKLIFISAPSRRWARRERSQRLGISVGMTRFRLRDGTVVRARSLTYDERELNYLVGDAGFAPLASGSERSDEAWSRPEVCWTLASAV